MFSGEHDRPEFCGFKSHHHKLSFYFSQLSRGADKPLGAGDHTNGAA